jgi:hypothetical protein
VSSHAGAIRVAGAYSATLDPDSSVEVPESMFDCRLPIANCQLPIQKQRWLLDVFGHCLWPISNQQLAIGNDWTLDI